jgi:MFS family permease
MSDIALDPAARFRSLSAAIIAMGVTAALYSLSLPLFAARLDEMGHSDAVIGINSAAQAVSLILVAPFAPRLLRGLGPAVFMLWMLGASFALILLVPLWENAWYWLVMRLLIGAATGLLWIAGEAWINEAADDASRGRTLALYGISGAGGTMAGFGILYAVGHGGWLPFLIMEVLILACVLAVAAALRVAPRFPGMQTQSMAALFRVAPTSLTVNLLVAVTFGSLATFMPVYGPAVGVPLQDAFLLLTLLSGGGLLQYPIGWLADHMDRRLLTLLVLAVMAALFAVMPSALADPLWRWPYVIVLGGGMMGLYTLSLILLGQHFRGGDLGAATTLFQIMWNTGMFAGPFAIGFAMDATGDRAFSWTLAACYGAFLAFYAIRVSLTRRRA